MKRNRTWLRTLIRLNAQVGETVPSSEIERQEDTVLRTLDVLDHRPGLMLADEVGMGKTYEALAVLAVRLHTRPDAKALILTPGPDLNTKWHKELRAFCDPDRPIYAGFSNKFIAVRSLAEIVEGTRNHQVIIAPATIFTRDRSQADLSYLLSLWALGRGLAGNQVAALFRHYRESAATPVSVHEKHFLNAFDWSIVEPLYLGVLKEHKAGTKGSLDAIWKASGYEGFSNKRLVERALADIRFRLAGRLIPDFDLLIVDEAHKLKNEDSVRTTGLRTVFEKRFERALFLTATPFQLVVSELEHIFSLFSLAKTAPKSLATEIERLLSGVDEYRIAFVDLEREWNRADIAVLAELTQWMVQDSTLSIESPDPNLRRLASVIRKLVKMKEEIVEPLLRKWMIRSLREDKRSYRRTQKTRIRPKHGEGVPFILSERFIAELFREKTPTHKAAAQINMVSSYRAARAGTRVATAATGTAGNAEAYRVLLKTILDSIKVRDAPHPKVDYVTNSALDAADQNEKTLIFCSRTETLRELKHQIDSKWEERLLHSWRVAFPNAALGDIFEHEVEGRRIDGHHSRLRDRFNRPQDALYLALRERYFAGNQVGVPSATTPWAEVVEQANDALKRQTVSKTQSERVDWDIAKRTIEYVSARRAANAPTAYVERNLFEHIAHEDYISNGLKSPAGDATDAHVPSWTITLNDVESVLRPQHLWSYLRANLSTMSFELRAQAVERIAGYLVSRSISFLPELLAFAKSEGLEVSALESRALLPIVDRFWATPAGGRWLKLLERFLRYANGLDAERRQEVLVSTIRNPAIARHTLEGESRERLREAFNTPLFPMILIANEVMQEGLDLHHHCRRVTHHDLAWNPAQLEQRVGRVDRLGSLVQRLRAHDASAMLDILVPLIVGTIDERLERVVSDRERLFEFMLGVPPNLAEAEPGDTPQVPFPDALVSALRIHLTPPLRT